MVLEITDVLGKIVYSETLNEQATDSKKQINLDGSVIKTNTPTTTSEPKSIIMNKVNTNKGGKGKGLTSS